MGTARRWIPNALTALRMLLLPVVIGLLPRVHADAGPWARARLAVIALFFLLAITDWFDGYLARRLDATSRWGSVADAVADRLALLVPLFYLALGHHPAFPAVPLWIPVWLLALDVAAGASWLVARARGAAHAPVSHTMVGRVGVWILYGLILWILVGLPSGGVGVLGLAGLTLATASVLLHVRRWLDPVAGRRHPGRSNTPV